MTIRITVPSPMYMGHSSFRGEHELSTRVAPSRNPNLLYISSTSPLSETSGAGLVWV